MPHLAHCLHHARRVGFCHHPTLSNSGSYCRLHQEPRKSRTGLSLPNLLASCQSKRPCQAWILLAFLVASCPFVYLSLKLHHVGHSLSNLCLCCLPHVSHLSDEACAHRVHVYCYLFTESSSCRRSFFDWATPVKLCSSVFCMRIDCLLHQFLGSIQERVRVPH